MVGCCIIWGFWRHSASWKEHMVAQIVVLVAEKRKWNTAGVFLAISLGMASHLGWHYLLPVPFFGRHSTFLTFLTSRGLHCSKVSLSKLCALPFKVFLQGHWPYCTVLGFPHFPFQSRWKPWGHHHSCFVRSHKTSITWVMPAQAITASSWIVGVVTCEYLNGWTREKNLLSISEPSEHPRGTSL